MTSTFWSWERIPSTTKSQLLSQKPYLRSCETHLLWHSSNKVASVGVNWQCKLLHVNMTQYITNPSIVVIVKSRARYYTLFQEHLMWRCALYVRMACAQNWVQNQILYTSRADATWYHWKALRPNCGHKGRKWNWTNYILCKLVCI